MFLKSILPLLLFLLLVTGQLYGQSIYTPVSMGMGGGSVSGSSGYEALFANPANLHFPDREYRLQITAGTAGFLFSPPSRNNRFSRSYIRSYIDHIRGFNPGDGQPVGDLNEFLDRNYSSDPLLSEHHAKGDIHWFGLHIPGAGRSMALSLRSRYANRYSVGRHFFDSSPVEVDKGFEIDRTLHHQFQTIHELSFGYAESFTFFNGLFPQPGELTIGIAPKVIASGAFLDARYEETGLRTGDDPGFRAYRSFRHQSAGIFTDNMQRRQDGSLFPPGERSGPDQRDLFSISGYGGGIDAGLTYLIPLGTGLISSGQSPALRGMSIRFSFALTDIGFIHYTDNPATIFGEEESSESGLPEHPSEQMFSGRPGEYPQFLESNRVNPVVGATQGGRDPFSVLLPAALHAGTLFSINRLTLTGDFSLGLTNNAFNTTRFITYLGAEVYLLPFLPVRAGTRFGHRLPDMVSFGTGIETRYFDMNIAVQLRNLTEEVAGMSFAAIRFYIP